MIELNKFSVHIIGGNQLPGGYVEMSHDSVYKIQLRNGNFRRADAYISIDGKEVGAWRVNANSTIVLERPVDDNGKFTFYEISSYEAEQTGLQNITNFDLGLISVRFELEKAQPQAVRFARALGRTSVDSTFTTTSAESMSLFCMDFQDSSLYASASSHSAGGTGLSGESNQRFVDVAGLEIDSSWTTTVNIRLVAKKKSIRPLVAHSNIAPQSLSR